MNDLVSSVSSQTQDAISEGINEQVLSQVQATLSSGQGQVPRKWWNVPAEGPESRPEEAFNRKCCSSSRDEFPRCLVRDEVEEDTHYKIQQLLFYHSPERIYGYLNWLLTLAAQYDTVTTDSWLFQLVRFKIVGRNPSLSKKLFSFITQKASRRFGSHLIFSTIFSLFSP